MGVNNDTILSKELEALLDNYPEEDILFFREMIKQTDLSIIKYETSIIVTEDGSNGKSE